MVWGNLEGQLNIGGHLEWDNMVWLDTCGTSWYEVHLWGSMLCGGCLGVYICSLEVLGAPRFEECLHGSISPRNSPRQSVIAEGFAEANSVFIVITSAKILPRRLFPSKIYIQFTTFNTYF